jgi:hypothetical protein
VDPLNDYGMVSLGSLTLWLTISLKKTHIHGASMSRQSFQKQQCYLKNYEYYKYAIPADSHLTMVSFLHSMIHQTSFVLGYIDFP